MKNKCEECKKRIATQECEECGYQVCDECADDWMGECTQCPPPSFRPILKSNSITPLKGKE